MPHAPRDEGDEEGCPGDERNEHEAAQAGAEQRRESQACARKAQDAPGDGLHPELVPVDGSGAELRRKRVPRLGEDADERPSDRSGNEISQPPAGAQHDRLRQVDRRALGGDPDHRLHGQEYQRDPADLSVAAVPGLPEDDGGRERSRDDDPGGQPPELPRAVEDEDRQDSLRREGRDAAAREVAPARFGELYAARRRRRSCRSHHSIPHSQ